MGLAQRRLYKPERRLPKRKVGVLYGLAPIGCPDANEGEVAKAIFSLAHQAGVIVGQGSGYDQLRDEYTVIGKSLHTGKAQDFKIDGSSVATLIRLARALNGGKMEFKRDAKSA